MTMMRATARAIAALAAVAGCARAQLTFTGTTGDEWHHSENWDPAGPPCGGETAILPTRDGEFGSSQRYTVSIGRDSETGFLKNATAFRINFSPNTYIQFSAPAAGESFLGLKLRQQPTPECLAARTISPSESPTQIPTQLPTLFPSTPVPTEEGATEGPTPVTDENGNIVTVSPGSSSNADSDDSSDGSGTIIALAIIIALLLVIVGVMCYRQGKGQKQDAPRTQTAFNNPTYSDLPDDPDGTIQYAAFDSSPNPAAVQGYTTVEGNYENTINTSSSLPSAGYLEVSDSQPAESHYGGDTYGSTAQVQSNNEGAEAPNPALSNNTIQEPPVEAAQQTFQFFDDDDGLEASL